ncbi:MAG TPA: PaaI family thioesterase [Hyphomicrobiaceae bacterium]|jgi:uncharacterized protein (TIGR00369 family)
MSNMAGSVGVPSPDMLKSLSGIEYLQRIVDGRLPRPPITETLGFAIVEVAPGFALFTMTPQFRHYNPIGTVHGGVAATLLDSCMSCAVQTHLEPGTGYTTLEIKVNMVRPITDKTGPIRAEGRSLHVGRRSATAEGRILDMAGTLLAHATTTCIIFAL